MIPTYGQDTCLWCGETIHDTNGNGKWASYADTTDGHTGAVIHRSYVYDCDDLHTKPHVPQGREPTAPREPTPEDMEYVRRSLGVANEKES